MKSNYNVYTSQKCNYKIITKLLNNYIVITSLLFFSTSSIALTFDAPLTEGSLAYGRLDPGEEVFVESSYLNNGKTSKNLFQIPSTKDRRFVIGIPQDAPKLSLTIKTATGAKTRDFPVQSRAWNEEYVSGLPSATVSLSSENRKRVATESAQIRAARARSDYPAFPTKFQRPVPDFKRISSHFGSRRILNNVKKQGHSGTDYAAPTGTLVLAPAAGRVAFVHPDLFYTGQTILLDHGAGVFSSYSHLSHINVKLDQQVKQGDPIGRIGTTGRSTGPHLHFVLSWYGVRIDPETLF